MKYKWIMAVIPLLISSAGLTMRGTAKEPVVAPEQPIVSLLHRMRTDTITVPSMQCDMCEQRIREKLKGVPGIHKVVANSDTKRVVVTYEPEGIWISHIEKLIAEVGYDAGKAKASETAKRALPGCCRPPVPAGESDRTEGAE